MCPLNWLLHLRTLKEHSFNSPGVKNIHALLTLLATWWNVLLRFRLCPVISRKWTYINKCNISIYDINKCCVVFFMLEAWKWDQMVSEWVTEASRRAARQVLLICFSRLIKNKGHNLTGEECVPVWVCLQPWSWKISSVLLQQEL